MTTVLILVLSSSANVCFGASGIIYEGEVMLGVQRLCNGARADGPLLSHLPPPRSQESW